MNFIRCSIKQIQRLELRYAYYLCRCTDYSEYIREFFSYKGNCKNHSQQIKMQTLHHNINLWQCIFIDDSLAKTEYNHKHFN